MRHLLMAVALGSWVTPAAAQTELATHYRPALDACVEAAETAQGLDACTGLIADPCMEQEPGGMTTQGMSMCIHAEGRVWDDWLNREYQLTMGLMGRLDEADRATSPEFAVRTERLRDAQRAWITFRDADCAVDVAFWGSGSMRALMGPSCLSQRTFERVKDLIQIREYLP